jgi:hypothetical protein
MRKKWKREREGEKLRFNIYIKSYIASREERRREGGREKTKKNCKIQ